MKKIKVCEYEAIFQKEPEGGYSVWVPSLSGCASQGETIEESLKNIKEAIKLYLDDKPCEQQNHHKNRKQFSIPVAISYA
jgi:predicted RNase H-like HicB family nuclease